MGNEMYEPHSVEEYKGIKFGQKVKINDEEYTVYRIDDEENTITLVNKKAGFQYIKVDDLLNLIKN